MLRSFQRITDFLKPTDDRGTRGRTGDVGVDIFDDEERSDMGGWHLASTKGEGVAESRDDGSRHRNILKLEVVN